MKFRKEHTPVPGGEPKLLGAGLTPEMVAPWGLAIGKKIQLHDKYVDENPFEVIVVGFQSRRVAFGVIVESAITQNKYVLVPRGPKESGTVIPCSDDEYEQAVEETTYGELTPREEK